MALAPGMHEIPDPEAEMERLAAARKRPPVPGPDDWSVETVERVKVTHLATGRSAEAPTQSEAVGKLIAGLVTDGDTTIGGPRDDSKESE